MQFIDLKTQYLQIDKKVQENIDKVLAHGQFILGPEVKELEEKLAEYTGAKHAVTVASGTDALLMSLMALGIGQGDEVITTPFTFIATAETIALAGAKPVFVDIDAQTYNMDPGQIEAAITDKTKAIMPVALYGQCADMDRINEIAGRYNLTVIEDAAQSFGATYKERKSCALSPVAATSFFPAKPLGAYGDGGACFTESEEIADTLVKIRNHGQGKRYEHERLGVNGRLDTMQAAILLPKLGIFPKEVRLRHELGMRYSKALAEHVVTPFIAEGNTSVYAQYTIQVPDRERFLANMKEKEIPTAVHYPIPLHLQEVFQYLGHQKGDYPMAEKIADHVVSLPMHPYLSENDQDRVVEAVRGSL